MKLLLAREVFTDKSTIGKLYIDDKFQCYTLEDVDRKLESGGVKIKAQTCIPRGTYRITITLSNRFKKPLPLLHNVPQFEGIRIHAGNTDANTEGCILLGTTRSTDFIGGSRLACDEVFAKLQKALNNKETVMIEVK